jgi:putative FmdB family regulatory protein
MPLYDYECGKCAHKFEMRKSFSDGAITQCPRCNSDAERVFAPVPIVFKGSGFYVTDYRKEKTPSETKEKAPVAEKSACKTECKTDCSAPGSCCSSGPGSSKN